MQGSIAGKGEVAEIMDLSGPRSATERETTREDDERVRNLLGRFAVLDGIRGWLLLWHEVRRGLLFVEGGSGMITCLKAYD